MLCPQVSGHANQLMDKTDLGFAHFGHGVAKVVVRGHAENFDPFPSGEALQFLEIENAMMKHNHTFAAFHEA